MDKGEKGEGVARPHVGLQLQALILQVSAVADKPVQWCCITINGKS